MATLQSYALTNVADVKESLGIASSDHTYDNLIIRKINQATAVIEAYCDRRFASTSYTEEYDASHIDALVLRQRPLISVTSFQVRDSGFNDSDWNTIDSELYFTDTAAGVLKLLFAARGYWNRYKVTYTAGYATIPDDLAEACASLAGYYANLSPADVNLKSKTEGSRKIEYAESATNTKQLFALLGIDTTLDMYANNPLGMDK